MGEVYRARDTSLGREVAVNVLPDQFGDDVDRLARFEREARTLASLNHPNIGAIHGSAGPKGPALQTPDALAIARQIAAALEAAHGQGIIHRDLKPANIKVRSDGTVKVLIVVVLNWADDLKRRVPFGR